MVFMYWLRMKNDVFGNIQRLPVSRADWAVQFAECARQNTS